MKDVDDERMAASHSLGIRQSMGKKRSIQDSARDRILGSEPTDGRSAMLTLIAAASAVAAPTTSLDIRRLGYPLTHRPNGWGAADPIAQPAVRCPTDRGPIPGPRKVARIRRVSVF